MMQRYHVDLRIIYVGNCDRNIKQALKDTGPTDSIALVRKLLRSLLTDTTMPISNAQKFDSVYEFFVLLPVKHVTIKI